MKTFPQLRNALRTVERAPKSDHRDFILQCLLCVLDYCEFAVSRMPMGDAEFVESVSRNIAFFARQGRWMDATVAAVNMRCDLASDADETYVQDEDEPHGVRMPMGGGK